MALKHSKQRDMILAFLTGRKDHPTAETVYANVRKTYPNISLGTVYRNLTLLADLGMINRLHFQDGADHFDADTSPHCHFVCTECGGITDLGIEADNISADFDNADFDGKIEGHVTYFYGTCGGCIGRSVSPQAKDFA